MSEEEYVNLCCDFLEILPPETTIHRLAGNGLKKNLIAPRWLGAKLDCLNKIDREFIKKKYLSRGKTLYKCLLMWDNKGAECNILLMHLK